MAVTHSDIVRVTLIGTFRRDLDGLKEIYEELIGSGCQVLSPRRLDFDDAEFVRDDAEHGFSEAELERFHLSAIRQSLFVWLHAPDGYVGASGAFELGYATALGVPVFSLAKPTDVTLRWFVRESPSVYRAKRSLFV